MLVGLTLTACSLFGCSDESMPLPLPVDPCQCAEGQVCSQAKICYDNPACEICGADEVCVSGECYSNKHPCSLCTPEQVCRNQKCYELGDPCLECTTNQICSEGRCFDKGDPCAACHTDQVCVGGACYAPTDPCAKCEKTHVCKDEICYEADDPCLKCNAPNVCFKGQCVSPNETCDPACGPTELCANGTCEPCEVTCGNACCGENELCDIVLGTCREACDDGKARCNARCCNSNQVCDPVYGCITPCQETQTRCDNPIYGISMCCNPGQVCEDYFCKEDCLGGVRCNEVCCAVGDVCEDNTCKIACDATTHTRCGEKEEFCCDNATQLCLYGSCMPRGIDCTKSSQCAFDEFCEESTMTCVNVDAMPSTCQVIPTFETFKALKQWQWPQDLPGGAPVQHPDYIRVIIMPMAANFTDDNQDGAVNADDIPDVVFIAYSTKVGPDTQAPSVLRVISGDDGREIASSEPRYWTYPIDAAVADIDNDGHVEILVGTNLNRPNYVLGGDDKLEALTVVPDTTSPTGFKLQTKYSITITKGAKLSFISVADLDADGSAEVLTNDGVASVVDGQFAWREGCHKSMSYPHAADLDNDGKMEIVTAGNIMDDHCNVLASGLPGGQIAIADMMPSGPDAEETGELIPETAHTISGMRGGSFKFAKIFKKKQEDGTYKWSVKESWKAPIPISFERAKARGYDCTTSTHNQCNSGGGTPVVADFNGDGRPDIGVAARYYYIVYSNDGTPDGGKVLWADANTQDYSSAVTGSSVFDFEGDGVAEVVYADETKLRVYSGKGSGVDTNGDGYPEPDIIFEVPNYSATGYEYPIIADVDNDGSTEIVLSSDMQKGVTMGVTAYEDPGGQWVRTRRIWNQHFYHVTNINEDGTVPKNEIVNWLHPKLNNYRQNTQPGGLFNAPNLVAESLSGARDTCANTPKTLQISAKVANKGSLGIKAGLEVKFYVANANGTGKPALIQTMKLPTILTPGNDSTISFQWDMTGIIEGTTDAVTLTPNAETRMYNIYYVIDAPTEEKVRGEFVECIEDDNTSSIFDLKACDEDIN